MVIGRLEGEIQPKQTVDEAPCTAWAGPTRGPGAPITRGREESCGTAKRRGETMRQKCCGWSSPVAMRLKASLQARLIGMEWLEPNHGA